MKPWIAVIILGHCVATPLRAQEGEKPKTPHGTKVAVVNVGVLFNCITNAYSKGFDGPLWAAVTPLKEKAKKLIDEANGWDEALKNGKVAEMDKEQYVNAIKQNRLELENMNTQIKRVLADHQRQHYLALCREVNTGIAEVAKANGYQIVLGYGDPVDKELLDKFPNVSRKKEAIDLGSTVPLYVHGSADITQAVVEAIHARRKVQPVIEPKISPAK